MANNFPRYFGAPAAQVLTVNDVAEGDKLVRLVERGGNWGSRVEYSLVEMVVVKVLKTRVVVKDTATDREYRVMVESGKYMSSRHGEITTRIEGHSASYNAPSIQLATPDDAGLLERIATIKERNAAIEVKQEAAKALETFKASMTVENAEATIEALQAWIASQK